MELALLVELLHTHRAAMKRFQTNPKRLGYSQGMNDSWNVAQYSEKDVDQEVGIAATFEEHAKRWQYDREDDFADVAVIDEQLA